MSVIETLGRMQRDAVEQLRAGEHNEFLVGFLTTSVVLELSNLVAADLDLAGYAQAAVDVLTQHAPVERCALAIEPVDLPAVSAAVGVEADPDGGLDLLDGEQTVIAEIAVDGVATARLQVADVPAALRSAGFVQAAADQIGSGLGRVVEGEHLRRRAAAAKALRVMAGLDERWNVDELEQVAGAIAALPGVVGATLQATAARFAGTIVADAGRPGALRVERQLVVDEQLAVDVRVEFATTPAEDQLARVDEVIEALSVGLERIEQHIRLAADADTDQLTGVGNRRRASKALIQARAMADARNEPMAVLLCDLDHLKEVNERFGHAVGDAVLVRFAALLRSSVRTHDTVIRWGGEEFLVICPACDETGAAGLAQRLIDACTDACRESPSDDLRQTASIGVAVYPTAARTPEALVSAADDALYRAKRAGRNRLATAGG